MTATRVAIYLRVSTGEQTTENQRRELEQVAKRSGWQVVEVYEDAGISGANGREKRPAFDKLLPGAPGPRLQLADTTCRWAAGGQAKPYARSAVKRALHSPTGSSWAALPSRLDFP